ncbi:hypothetical protein D6C87_05684 [Aureobasidium pullulans]|uniref:Uncharacterized protein n=1 Tax=Aureobasidium pullulans TaxID=5580 RepID=A0AB38LNU8_AURPU|nr:hypothetical protein D6C94_08595 [Aureobasidium pullulans]THZ41504.1 hypothetical protein D6C87_05684 [Aureobasidium pullulans]
MSSRVGALSFESEVSLSSHWKSPATWKHPCMSIARSYSVIWQIISVPDDHAGNASSSYHHIHCNLQPSEHGLRNCNCNSNANSNHLFATVYHFYNLNDYIDHLSRTQHVHHKCKSHSHHSLLNFD